MLGHARSAGIGSDVQLVVAVGERLPLVDDAVDVAWLSAVIHHIADGPACAAELRRVVVPGGRLFVRGFFAGLSRVGWLPFFPGADRAVDRFPRIEDVVALLAAAGFSLVVVEEAPEPATPVSIVIEWLVKMRHADSLLSALSDAEFDTGLGALRRTDERSVSGALHLAVFG
jgi:SAM-dependent methyltransferase